MEEDICPCAVPLSCKKEKAAEKQSSMVLHGSSAMIGKESLRERLTSQKSLTSSTRLTSTKPSQQSLQSLQNLSSRPSVCQCPTPQSSDSSIDLDPKCVRPYAVPKEKPQTLKEIAEKSSEAPHVKVKPERKGDTTGGICPPPSPPPGCDILRLPSSKVPQRMRLYHRDRVREMIIPSKDTADHAVVISQKEYFRLLETASVPSASECKELEEWRKEAKNHLYEANRERKEELNRVDKLRVARCRRQSDFSLEAMKEKEQTMEHSRRLRLEQEQEIRHVNQCILNAKCMAIRQAQIEEKALIQKEVEKEEKRLDDLMEVARQQSIMRQKTEEEMKLAKALLFAEDIRKQQQEREFQRILEADRRDQEAAISKRLEDMRMEKALKDQEEEHKRRMATKMAALKENEAIQQRKREQKELDRLSDLKVAEWMRQKAEREAALEEQQSEQKREKDRQLARMRAMQQREMDHQAERDVLRAQRIQEEVEREWRQKEKEQVLQRRKAEEDLKMAREEQIHNRNYCLGLEAQRERTEFMRILEAQKNAMEKEKFQEAQVQREREKFAKAIRAQIVAKAESLLEERRQKYMEGEKIKQERKHREQEINRLLEIKIQELKQLNFPEKLICEIIRCVHKADVS